jgi:hypothetical protein
VILDPGKLPYPPGIPKEMPMRGRVGTRTERGAAENSARWIKAREKEDAVAFNHAEEKRKRRMAQDKHNAERAIAVLENPAVSEPDEINKAIRATNRLAESIGGRFLIREVLREREINPQEKYVDVLEKNIEDGLEPPDEHTIGGREYGLRCRNAAAAQLEKLLGINEKEEERGGNTYIIQFGEDFKNVIGATDIQVPVHSTALPKTGD